MAEIVSKSEQKRRFKQIEEVARELAELSNNDLKKLPCDDEIKEEIKATRGLKGGARKRQIKYLAKVMRQTPMDTIYEFLSAAKGSKLKEDQVFHEAERLRDVLINEAMEDFQNCKKMNVAWEPSWHSDILEEIKVSYPTLDGAVIRKTIYQYVKSYNKVHYRELFRMIKAAMEQEEIRKKMQNK